MQRGRWQGTPPPRLCVCVCVCTRVCPCRTAYRDQIRTGHRSAAPRCSQGAHRVLSGYSQSAHRVLAGYSKGAHRGTHRGARRVLTGCSQGYSQAAHRVLTGVLTGGLVGGSQRRGAGTGRTSTPRSGKGTSHAPDRCSRRARSKHRRSRVLTGYSQGIDRHTHASTHARARRRSCGGWSRATACWTCLSPRRRTSRSSRARHPPASLARMLRAAAGLARAARRRGGRVYNRALLSLGRDTWTATRGPRPAQSGLA